VNKLALFNDSVGEAVMGFFEELDIALVWPAGGSWVGSPLAQAAELCDGVPRANVSGVTPA
jgi:hypothetical protein